MKKALSFFIGLLLVFFSIEILTCLSAYFFVKVQDQKNIQVVPTDKNVIRLVTIGESTTAVAANKDNTLLVQDTAYPYALEKYLNQHAKKYKYKVDNKGIMSGNSVRAVAELKDYLEVNKPNLVISMLGMKDHVITDEEKEIEFYKQIKAFFLNFKTISLIKLYLEQYELNKNNIYDNKVVASYSDLNPAMKNLANHFVTRSVYQQGLFENYSLDYYKKIIKPVYLVYYFFFTGQNEKAERLVLELIRSSGFGYFILADIYIGNNEFQKAEDILFRYKKEKGENPFLYAKLIKLYLSTNEWEKAKALFNKTESIKFNDFYANLLVKSELDLLQGKNLLVRDELTKICGPSVKLPEYVDNKATFQAWLKSYAERDLYYQCLFVYAEASFNLGSYDIAEKGLRELIKNKKELNTGAAFNLLLKIYYKSNTPEKAEDLINFMMDKNKRLGEYYALINHYKIYQQSPLKLEEFENNIVNTFTNTVDNYNDMYQATKRHNVKLMIMQYPTFPISMMKKFIAAKNENYSDVIFFSNEHVFDNYVKSDVFFEPRYPYNFNHYTKKGAEVLAAHVGEEILNIFEK